MTGLTRRLAAWIGAGVGRRLVITLSATLVVASLAFLTLFIGLYSSRLAEERSNASAQVNQLLQVSLENAMLKRDIPGLRGIVERLGAQERIANVMILNPAGLVRFAADRSRVGQRFELTGDDLCPDCALDVALASFVIFTEDPAGHRVLRSVNPVPNRAPCITCHGPVKDHPVNGILVVDYQARDIKQAALAGAFALAGSGLIVLFAAITAIWLVLRTSVLRPLRSLTDASRALSEGALEMRLDQQGDDELAVLRRAFNRMAARLQESLSELAERERFLQAVIDAVPDGIRLIDQQFMVIKANRAYYEQLGLTPDRVIGRPCYMSSHRRDMPCPPTLVTCPLNGAKLGELPLTCRHQHQRIDGQPFLVEVSANALQVENPDGRRTLVVESIRDLSKEMRISHEQKLSELGLLAAGVAHEIRNPMASMRLSLQSLKRDLGGPTDADALDDLQVMDDELEKCIQVTDRLLKLSTPAREQPELVAINDVVRDIMSLLCAEAETRRIEIAFDLDDGLRVIAADADIRMLVLNLAQNAFHAMPTGGRLKLSSAQVGKDVQVTFEDDGVGIRPEDLPRIFDPFWSRRADGVRGTGLGLSVCRTILKRYRGRIEVASDPGRGSRFVVVMPSADVVGAAP